MNNNASFECAHSFAGATLYGRKFASQIQGMGQVKYRVNHKLLAMAARKEMAESHFLFGKRQSDAKLKHGAYGDDQGAKRRDRSFAGITCREGQGPTLTLLMRKYLGGLLFISLGPDR